MPAENPYRAVLLVVVVLASAVALFHRRRAASSETISHAAEGRAYTWSLRVAALALWLSTLGYLLLPAYFPWASLPLPTWLRWSGAALAVGSTLLLHWTLHSLGKNLTDTVVTRAAATLVTHGPYRWVRHPYYVAAALLMLAVTLLTANWLIGGSSLLVLALLVYRTPLEERMLLARFGDEYRHYMATTGRFFPRFR